MKRNQRTLLDDGPGLGGDNTTQQNSNSDLHGGQSKTKQYIKHTFIIMGILKQNIILKTHI